ncbi:MAG: hypothetical protein ACJ8C4_17300 [Gemmataceae bacterium]
MRSILAGLAAGLVMTIGAATASAQYPCSSCDSCGSSSNCCQPRFFARFRGESPCDNVLDGHRVCGAYNSTKQCLFTGAYPSNAPTCKPTGPLAFPTHPYVRSPRDFFMMD